MKAGTIAALAITGIIIFLVAAATGAGGLMMWALALNGFMGNETAVNVSLITYVVTAIISGLLVVTAGVLTVRYLTLKRSWNAAAAAALSSIMFSLIAGAAHVICVVISAIIASALRN